MCNICNKNKIDLNKNVLDNTNINTMSSLIISIEGNIGSGKSSFLSHLKERFGQNENIVFIKEPVDEWESIVDEEGKSMLQKFYEDPKRYSFSFQMMAYISRLSIMLKAIQTNPKYIITERCLLTDKFIFAKMLFDEGKIEKVEYDIYNKWFNEFSKTLTINEIVYIKSDPKICIDRIKKRGRNGEDSISLDYISKCHQYHEFYIQEIQKTLPSITINEIDGNLEVNSTSNYIYDEWIRSLNTKLED
jgi:deoxyadenosine/deoxycytidine kinase